MIGRRAIRRTVAYGLASVVALGVDMICFLALMGLGMFAPAAAVCGYAVGIGAHWLASSRVVFAERLAETGRARTTQQGLFVASALVGLALTWIIVSLGTMAGLDPRIAKLLAIGASFAVTFALRLKYVFAQRQAVTDR